MATLADDTGNWDVAVVIPEDGDQRDAGSVGAGMTSMNRRIRFVHDVVFRENGNPGLFRQRIVTSTAFLRVITEHVTSDFCWVRRGTTGARLYVYSETSTEADDDDFIVRPANVSDAPPTTPGRWVFVGRYLYGSNKRLLAPHGLAVDGEASFDADITAQASITIGQLLIVLGAATLQNVSAHDINASGSINAGGTLGCTGDAGFGGEVLMMGRAYAFDGLDVGADVAPRDAKITGKLRVNDKATLAAGVDITGNSTLTHPIVASGAGRLRNRTRVMNVDDNVSLTPSTVSWFLVPEGLLTTFRNLTLSDTGAGEGDEIEIVTEEGSHSVFVKNQAGTILISLMNNVISGNRRSARFGFLGGEWRVLSFTPAFA